MIKNQKRLPRQKSSDTLRPTRPVPSMVRADGNSAAADEGPTPAITPTRTFGIQSIGGGRAGRQGLSATREIGYVSVSFHSRALVTLGL